MLKEKGWLILPDSMLRINFDIISVFFITYDILEVILSKLDSYGFFF